jgi:hypothetical protein
MSPHTTSLAPEFDVTVHIVLDDFGKAGRAYRETAEEAANFDAVVDDLMTGQFNNPVRVIAFARAGHGMFPRMWPENCLGGPRKKISRSPAPHAGLSNCISAKRKYCALGSSTKAPGQEANRLNYSRAMRRGGLR